MVEHVGTCHNILVGGDIVPSKTFLNLDKEKQDKLLAAAWQEFRSVRYPEVSINQIILTAKIPRGSFYMYFRDKEDLFEYMLETHRKQLDYLVVTTLQKCHGDLRSAFIELFDITTKKIIQNDYIRLMKNMVFFFNLFKEKFRMPGHVLFEHVKASIDVTTVKSEDLEFIFHMLLHNLLMSLAEVVHGNELSIIREQYIRKLNILCYGIYKEETEC